jgi:hypothetical protein
MTQQEFDRIINRGTAEESCVECEMIQRLTNCIVLMLDHMSPNGGGPIVSQRVRQFMDDIGFRY